MVASSKPESHKPATPTPPIAITPPSAPAATRNLPGRPVDLQTIGECLVEVRKAAQKHRTLTEFTADWHAGVADGEPVILSAKLAPKHLARDRVLLHKLNHHLKSNPVCGHVLQIHKPKNISHYTVRAILSSSALTVWTDETFHLLEQRIRQLGGAKRVVMIQHSGDAPRHLITVLMRDYGAEVDLYLRDPANAINPTQEQKIRNIIKEVPGYFGMVKTGRLTIYTVDVPASLRIVSVDNRLIASGFYFYYPMVDETTNCVITEMQGHSLPQMLFAPGDPGFTEVSDMVAEWLTLVEPHRKLATQWPPPKKDPARP